MSAAGGDGLRDLLRQGPVLAPGVTDALSARLADRAGARMLYLSGAAVTATRRGLPDLGYLGLGDVLAVASQVVGASGLPLLVDGDTGFGSVLQVADAVRSLERIGVAAIQLEDQESPKRCGALTGKSVVDQSEAMARVRAAVRARSELMIVARTDALAFEGLDGVIRRCAGFAAEGADLVFPAGLTTIEQVESVAAEVDLPIVFNCTEAAGVTRWPSVDALAAAGAPLVIMPVTGLVAMTRALIERYALIVAEGTAAALPSVGWDAVNAALDLDEILAEESALASPPLSEGVR